MERNYLPWTRQLNKKDAMGSTKWRDLNKDIKQVVKVIWHKAASPPHMDGSVVFARWRQRAPHTKKALEPRNQLCLHRIAWPRKPTPRIKQHVASYDTAEVIAHRKAKSGCDGNIP